MALYKAIGTITTTDFRTVKNNDFVTGTITVLDSENSEFNGTLGMGFGLSGGTPIKFRYNTGRGSTFRLEPQNSGIGGGVFGSTSKPKTSSGVTLGNDGLITPIRAIEDPKGDNDSLRTANSFDFKSTKMIAIYVVVAIIIATFVYFKFIKK